MHNYTFTFILLLISSFAILAQDAKITYDQAVNDINCATVKLLLRGFDRPFAANKIKPCNYDAITREVKDVKENKIRGYKQMILNLAQEINGYKDQIINTSDYLVYEKALNQLTQTAEQGFINTCETFRQPDNKVCINLSNKIILLRADLKQIADKSLAKINKQIYSSGNKQSVSKRSTDQTNTQQAPNNTNAKTNTNTTTNNIPPISNTGVSSSNSNNWLATILIIGLLIAVGWLFKEVYELKERVEDMRMLLNVRNKNRDSTTSVKNDKKPSDS